MGEPLASSSDLADALQVECARFEAMLALLDAEQDALRRADADALSRLAAAKARLVDDLRRLAADRTQRLVAAELAATAAGMDALIARGADPQRARTLCVNLFSLAARVMAQNELNGRLLNIQRRFVDRAAAALWQAAGGTLVYDSDGRPRRAGPARTPAAI